MPRVASFPAGLNVLWVGKGNLFFVHLECIYTCIGSDHCKEHHKIRAKLYMVLLARKAAVGNKNERLQIAGIEKTRKAKTCIYYYICFIWKGQLSRAARSEFSCHSVSRLWASTKSIARNRPWAKAFVMWGAHVFLYPFSRRLLEAIGRNLHS